MPPDEKVSATATLQKRALDRLLDGTVQLGVLPSTAARALELTNDPNSDTSKIAAIVKADPGIAGRVLNLANSPMYLGALGTKTTSLERAIARIGMQPLKGVVLQIAMKAQFPTPPGVTGEVENLFKHGVYAAIATRLIAQTMRVDPELGFLVGLLHDIGRVIGIGAFALCPPDIQQQLAPDAESLSKLIDRTHESIGARVAKNWNLGNEIEHALEHHHQPTAKHVQWAHITRLGDLIAKQSDSDQTNDDLDVCTAPEAQVLRLGPGAMEVVLTKVPPLASELLSVMS